MGGRGGVTVHFPCRLGVGVRASEACTPTQEEMGLRFDFKPPSWCLVQFPKMAAHLLGGGIGTNYSKNIWFGDQARDKGRQWCSFREFNSEKRELEGAPG